MTYRELIAELQYLKLNNDILDYLIDSDFAFQEGNIYVKARLTVFAPTGKPSIMTAIIQGSVASDDVAELQDKALIRAYEQNIPRRAPVEDVTSYL